MSTDRGATGGRWNGLFVLADDDPRWKERPVEQARAACAGGARVVQLRAKYATDREALRWAAEIRALTRDAGVSFFVNDRFDLALAAYADGVHLGQDDLHPTDLPAAVREQLLVGRSTHTLEQVCAASEEAVDYLAFGPVFGTHSKASPYPPRGLPLLREAVQAAAPLPLVAIGGINAKNAADVAATGAIGAAVISAVASADDPEQAVGELVAAFTGAHAR
ncbi:MAG: thiamine phosphate synthase [Deltaproteobacteria bacterium]|nr:thiamine phosphate synthase [Deltaproteobacteria bacterium]